MQIFSKATKEALLGSRSQLSLLRPEVVHREMMKIWSEPNTGDTFSRIAELGYLPLLFPAVGTNCEASDYLSMNGDQPLAMKLAQFACYNKVTPDVLYAGLSYNKKACTKAESLYVAAQLMAARDVAVAKTAFCLLDDADRKLACKLYTQFNEKKSELYVRICEKHEALAVRDLAIRSNDLVELGFRRKEIGSIQRWLLGQVYLDETINVREILEGLINERGRIDGKDTN